MFPSLEHLIFGYHYNQPVDLNKLTQLKTLDFGNCFKQPIDNLNKLTNLEYLYFSDEFNQAINLNNLTKLKYLRFGPNFNHPIDVSIFNELKKLIFGNSYTQTIFKLPNSIKYLRLGKNQPINDKLYSLLRFVIENMLEDQIRINIVENQLIVILYIVILV